MTENNEATFLEKLLVKKLIETAGWRVDDCNCLLPPRNDKRLVWCSAWYAVTIDGEDVYVPEFFRVE